MRFSDLLNLPYDSGGNIELAALSDALPHTPSGILEQLYSAHGRKSEFQDQYASLDLDGIRWIEGDLEASSIIAASVYPEFRPWFDSVSCRVNEMYEKGWNSIDVRPAVRESWEKNRTWLQAPILISGDLVGSDSKFHLVEGHTRVGLLKGLVAHGTVTPDSVHRVWVGKNAA